MSTAKPTHSKLHFYEEYHPKCNSLVYRQDWQKQHERWCPGCKKVIHKDETRKAPKP
jgi:hypothetical protein